MPPQTQQIKQKLAKKKKTTMKAGTTTAAGKVNYASPPLSEAANYMFDQHAENNTATIPARINSIREARVL